MAMAAKSFGRRPREEAAATKPAASLGAVLELLRALNWFIRADVPWPTKRGQAFDFVLAGESGVFAMWAHDGEPVGIEDAAAELGHLLGGIDVRPVVCRASSSLANADSRILFCTPDTALDLLVGLPAYQGLTPITTIVNRLRELVVPPPPEPTPPPTPVAVAPPKVETVAAPKAEPKPAPSVKQPAPVFPPVVKAPEPTAPPKPAPAEKPTPVEKATPVEKPTPVVKKPPAPVEESVPRIEESVVAPTEVEVPKPEKVSGGRHRSEKPKRARRTPPAPPSARSEEPKSTLELPTAIGSTEPRRKGGNEAAKRFNNDYVYVPPKVEKSSKLRREFRLKPFVFGLVGLLIVALAVGIGVKEWPKIKGLAGSPSNPSASFGQSISVNSTNFHPSLTITVTQPAPVSVGRGTVSYAVTLTVMNTGAAPWQLPDRSALTMTDSIGESSAVADIRGARWGGSVKAEGRWIGKLIFKLRSGRSPASLQLALASTNGETAVWK